MELRRARGFLAAFVIAALSNGCTYTVNSTADAPDAAPGDRTCADGLGRCTLRAAVMESNATSITERIEVPAGTYLLNLPPASGGGPLIITASTNLRGAGASSTIVDSGAVSLNPDVGGCASSGPERPVFRINGGTVNLSYLTIQGGFAQNGGGIFVNNGTVEIADAVIRRNAAFTGGGGMLVNNGVVRVRRSTITENCAVGAFGGGVNVQPAAQLWVYESLFSKNNSNRAGAIRNSGLLNLRSTTISGNTATSDGAGTGGISQNGFAVLNNVTITLNTGRGNNPGSFRGGGIQTTSGGTTVMRNSIIAKNDGLGGPNDCTGTAFTSDSRHNLIGDTAGCSLPAFTGTYLLNVDPKLNALASNGGPTKTHSLQNGSPAFNAAYEFPPPASQACELYDQRGVKRPPTAAGRCDLGAYEGGGHSAFITSFILVDADTDTDLFPIRNGELLNRTELPPNLSIRAQLSGTAGSVVFALDGDPSFQVETHAPYALGGDSPLGNYLPVALSQGEHMLRATPFALAAGAGAQGGGLELKFLVLGEPEA